MEVVEANGARIPAIGLGTMTLQDAVCVEAVKTALRLGYRHIDTAERYNNEAAVGEGLHQGLRDAGLKREDVFVTTKVYFDKLAAADFQRSFDESLTKLKLPWVDLLLIHWPNPKVPLAETLGVLCKAKRDGRAKHVGVANFTTTLLEEAAKLASEPLVTNQIEVHPFLNQDKVLAACRGHGLSAAGARQDSWQRDTRAHRQGAWQERVADRTALPRAAAHHPDPAHRQPRASRRQSRDLRFCLDR
jgi:2,5-diketo-D-gluconate reductase B